MAEEQPSSLLGLLDLLRGTYASRLGKWAGQQGFSQEGYSAIHRLFLEHMQRVLQQKYLGQPEAAQGVGVLPPELYPTPMRPPFENKPGQELFPNKREPGLYPPSREPSLGGDA